MKPFPATCYFWLWGSLCWSLVAFNTPEGCGGGLPFVFPHSCQLTGMNEPQKIHLSLLLWIHEGPWVLSSSVTMKEFTAREEKVAWGDLFFFFSLSHSAVNWRCSSLKWLLEQRLCDQAVLWIYLSAVALGKHLSRSLNYPEAPLRRVNTLVRSPSTSKGHSEIILNPQKIYFQHARLSFPTSVEVSPRQSHRDNINDWHDVILGNPVCSLCDILRHQNNLRN